MILGNYSNSSTVKLNKKHTYAFVFTIGRNLPRLQITERQISIHFQQLQRQS